MLKILFIGDINGKIGREAVKKILPAVRKEYKPDLIIANAENLAHGRGVTEKTLREIIDAGVDFCTLGDHAMDNAVQFENCLAAGLPVIRPANLPPTNPGEGYKMISVKDKNVLIINLLGRVFMQMSYDCPFRKLDEILANFSLPKNRPFAIIVDMHAEATSEKISLGHYADGLASAVFGTHTHIMTADGKITGKGTAYITDVGMVGYADGCLGLDRKNIIKSFLTQAYAPHEIPEKGTAIFNACLVKINKDGRADSIKTVSRITKIN